MQFYLAARGVPAWAAEFFWASPWVPKFTRNRPFARSVRKGVRASAPKRKKTDLWGPKGAKRWQNGAKMEASRGPFGTFWQQNEENEKVCLDCAGVYRLLMSLP